MVKYSSNTVTTCLCVSACVYDYLCMSLVISYHIINMFVKRHRQNYRGAGTLELSVLVCKDKDTNTDRERQS